MTIVRNKNDNYCFHKNKSELIKIQRIYSKYGKILIVDGIFLKFEYKLKEFQSLENDVCHARRCIGRK